MNNIDLVSIITPLYNAQEYIEDTIKSVQNQTYQNWEMIIVDDMSKDSGIEIVKKYIEQDKRIKLIRLKENSGAAVSRNRAIKEANGKYIAFLDSDDIWFPKKLEKQLMFIKKNEYAFTFTKYQQMAENGKKMNSYIDVPDTLNYEQALLKNPVGCLTAMYSVEKLGKVYMPLIKKRQDYGLWLKILKKGVTGYGLNETLAYYRLRKNSVSSNKFKLIKYQWKLYRKIEKMSITKSLFYLTCVIFQKVFKIK